MSIRLPIRSLRARLGWCLRALLATGALAFGAGGVASAAEPAHRYLFAPSFSSNMISVFDLDTQTLAASIGADARGPCCAHVTPDRSQVFVVDGQSPQVTVIDVASLRVTKVIRLNGIWGDRGAPIQRDGRMFWVSTLPDGNLEGIDVASGEVVRHFPSISNTFTVSRDGRNLYTANVTRLPTIFAVTASTVSVRSPDTGRVLAVVHLPLTLDPAPLQMYVSPDDTKLYVQMFGPQGELHVIDLHDRLHPRYVKTIHVGSVPIVANFSPDGSQLWFPNSGDGTVTIVDTTIDEVVHVIDVGVYVAGVGVLDGKAYVSVANRPVTGVLAMVQLFVQLMPGAQLTPPSGTTTFRPLLELPGEIRTYDAQTFEPLPVPAMQLPSASHVIDLFSTGG